MSSTGAVLSEHTAGRQAIEDLVDEIFMIDPIDTPLYQNLADTTANGSVHYWLTDSVGRSTVNNAVQEGSDASFSALAQPTRASNYVQEIRREYKVSWKQRSTNMAGITDQLDYEAAKATKRWKLDAEYSLIWGTGISGQSGTGWEMKGLKKAITTNYVSFASGTSLTEARFNDILQLAYDDVDDSTFQIYTSIGFKRNISAFTGGTTKFTDASARTLINVVDVYESDVFSRVELYKHRDISNANGMIIGIVPKYFRKAWMDRPDRYELPSSGAYSSEMIWGSLTLEFGQEKAGVRAENLLVA